jgi:nucleotide-binding universal stress UspA family protein
MVDRDITERWIVGMDGSDGSLAALRWAVRHSTGRPVRLESVRAESRSAGNRAVNTIVRLLHRARHSVGANAEAGAELDGRTTEITAGHDVTVRVVEGSAGPVLVDAASGASLLVVGRHGAGGGWRNALGSVSRYCVTHTSRPTVVVPPDWTDDRLGRIVVGFDGSANACAALDWALDFTDEGTEVVALIAIEVAPWLQEDVVHARLGEELEAERERLLGLLATADPAGRATADVEVRGAKAALARAAGSSDLIAVGARGTGLMAGMGSVSTWLLADSPCPVVVVPEPARS